MWELDGSEYFGSGLSLDLRSSDAHILRVSPSLSASLGVSPSVSDPLSLHDFLSPSESFRLLNSLLKGGVDSSSRKFLTVFTSQAKKKQFCFEVLESEIINSGDVIRVLLKDHHKHGQEVFSGNDKDDDLLSGFSVILNSVNHLVHRVSPNFISLLGHSAQSVLGTPLQQWLHSQDESSFSTIKKKESIRFRAAHGAFESFVYHSFEEVNKESYKMNFKLQSKGNEEEEEEERRIFSTLLQNEFRVRQVCCNNGLQLPNLNNRNFLELVSSPDDLHYLENRIRKKVPGLTRLYEIRMNPKWVLWIQTHFFIYPNNDILAHHFIVKDKEEKSQPCTLNQNNNVLKRKWPSGDVEQQEDSTTQKNKLLRELLNINYSVQDNLNTSSSSVTTSTSSSNSRILQLLNSKSPDGGGRRKTPPSVSKSFMCSQNPALADLLSKPPYHASTSVPPPVPTKWHQEPREKLPRDIMRKYLPPHPAERSKLNTESSPVNNCRPLVADTDHDPMLSEILDGVIDIQEKTPGSSRDIVQKRINLSDIEKFLSAAEVQQSVPTNQLYSPMVRQSSAGSSTPVPRINELLQVIPPNVTIPPNSEPSPYLLNVMSQRRSNRNHPPYDPAVSFSTSSASHFSSHLPHSQTQQQHLHMHQQQQQQLQQVNPEGRQEGSTSSSPMPSSKGGSGGSLLLQLLSE